MKAVFFLLAGLAPLLALSACNMGVLEMRDQVASRVARPAFMVERTIPANQFRLDAWERMNVRHEPATIYIEGDGVAWVSRQTPSLDPTPKNPVALHLAAMDKSDNVGWLARPCQYKGWNGQGPCPMMYWTDARTAPEVISAYHAALDNIRAMYDIEGFHLVGYSGGAAVAALLAAQRTDILSLRTVAGNLDYGTFTTLHDVSPLSKSLDPVSVAPQLARLPQHHFIGGHDDVVPPAIYQAWARASGPSPCVAYTLIEENEHTAGWVEKWPELLKIPMSCEKSASRPRAPVPQAFIDAKTKMPHRISQPLR